MNQEQRLLDHFISPKIIVGPHASSASRSAARRLHEDADYQELMQRLVRAGVFRCAWASVAWRIALFAGAYLAGYAYLLTDPGLAGCAVASVVIGLAHIHGNFVAHDAAHGAIARDERVNTAIGQLFDSFLGGYSFNYFRRAHDLHHFHCNEVDRDVNLMTRMFSLSPGACAEKTGMMARTTRWQHLLIPLLYPFWSFALRFEGVGYVLRNRRKAGLDGVLLLGHLALWCTLPVFVLGFWCTLGCYTVMTVVTGLYLAVIVPINHVGMPLLDASTPLSFIAQQVTTTRNLASSPVRDFLFMGQNSQIEHHLFPWAPTFRLARGRAIVRAFCQARGLPYHEHGYWQALREVHGHYARMARLEPGDQPAADLQPAMGAR